MSTTQLSSSLTAELSAMLRDENPDDEIISLKIKQLARLNVAMTILYTMAGLLALAGLLGGIEHFLNWNYLSTVTAILVCLGIISLLVALIYLIIYSKNAVVIKQRQFEKMD